MTTDAVGNVYAAGYLYGGLDGSSWSQAAVLQKYDSDGNEVWSRGFGDDSRDRARGLAVDASGNVYVTGSTEGNLAGPNAGEADLFVTKFDSVGTSLWTRQFGSPEDDHGNAIAVNAQGSVYVVDRTTDGSASWDRHPIVLKYDQDGNEQWSKMIDTSDRVEAWGVVTNDADEVFLTSHRKRTGSEDVMVDKLDPDGELVWSMQYGTGSDDRPQDLAMDDQGGLYVVGYTEGSLGQKNLSSGATPDVFFSKLDKDGQLLWSDQIGSTTTDYGGGIAIGPNGEFVIAGSTFGKFAEQQGSADAILAYHVPVTVPAPFVLGDLNGDTQLDEEDIAAFVMALTDPEAYALAYPGLNAQVMGDFTRESQLTNGDIQGFINALSESASQIAVPEPASSALLLAGLGLIARRRRV